MTVRCVFINLADSDLQLGTTDMKHSQSCLMNNFIIPTKHLTQLPHICINYSTIQHVYVVLLFFAHSLHGIMTAKFISKSETVI